MRFVCTGCSCLCDDIEIETGDGQVVRIENACVEGAAYIRSSTLSERRSQCVIKGRAVTAVEAVDYAARQLKEARSPFIFGLDRSTLEAQAMGIRLAQALKGTVDDNSSLNYGGLIQEINSGRTPSGSLAEAEDTDLLIYWGSNPYHSHPRHLSKYTYYSRERYHEEGWIPDVTLSCVEVRETETSLLCHPVFKIEHGGDRAFIEEILATIKGTGQTERANAFVQLLKKHNFGMIFVGLGLNYALDNNFALFGEMVSALSNGLRLSVIPMVDEFNMRGFNHLLYKETGYVNRVSFANGMSHGDSLSFLEQIANRASDLILVVGSDLISSLPYPLIRKLHETDIICIDPFATPTTSVARVTIGTAVPGLETGGTALRMDGEEVSLLQVMETKWPSDAEILRQLLDRVAG
jgi:formylmethanofuran dehydrogenase subunit B